MKAHPKDLAHDIRYLEEIDRINDVLKRLDWSHHDLDTQVVLLRFHTDHVSWMLHRLRLVAERGEQ